MSAPETTIQSRIASMIHAFSDEQRRYAVRLLANDVGEIERQLAAAQTQIATLKAERVETNLATQRLAARVKELEEALVSIHDYWNRDQNDNAMADACWHAVHTAHDALKAKEKP